uniref:Uncharacterized protein n=1 Tax=Babesia duncani TaxID=323732 RepID=A0A385GNG3_9APIC|nr:hypothetical protein [Babesia duncani]
MINNNKLIIIYIILIIKFIYKHIIIKSIKKKKYKIFKKLFRIIFIFLTTHYKIIIRHTLALILYYYLYSYLYYEMLVPVLEYTKCIASPLANIALKLLFYMLS